jgi:hypothetical protein
MSEPQQISVRIPKITPEQAKGFSNVWRTPGGLALVLDSAALQFAADFANIVLQSYICDQIGKAQAQAKKVPGETARMPEAPAPKLIVEG